MTGPLVTLEIQQRLLTAARKSPSTVTLSLDLQRTETQVTADRTGWTRDGSRYPYIEKCRDRTIYYWTGRAFEPVSLYDTALIKLVPTQWGAPTFEIDGIKMLPTAQVSPYADAGRKVALIEPRGKAILDTCGGLGYFAAWCVEGGAMQVRSFEKNPSVIWLRSLNPWSPQPGGVFTLTEGDISQEIAALPDASFDAVLHDPPRFGIAGELYSQAFYNHLARVLRRRGRLFHYTGTPNKLTTGRDVPEEVAKRLQTAGFKVRPAGDGLLAIRQ